MSGVNLIQIPEGATSILVDTRPAVSKLLQLPSVIANPGRVLMIKDFYGTAGTNAFTISTTGTDYIEDVIRSYTFSNSFGSVNFVSDGAKSWRFIGSYDGTASSTMNVVNKGVMASTVNANAFIVQLDVTSTIKTLTLPVVSTNAGRMLIIKDSFGKSGASTIVLSTVGADRFELSSCSTFILSQAYGSWTLLNDAVNTWYLSEFYRNTLTIASGPISIGASGFSPTSITGGIMWIDATLLSGTNGTTITTWASASPLYTLYMTGSGTLNTNILNGKQVISVNTGQSFTITNTGYTSASFTFFFVSRQTGGSNGRVFFGNGNTLYGYWGGYKNQLYMEGWLGGPYGTGSDTNWDIYTTTRNSSGAGVFSRYGTAIASYGGSGAGMTGFYINTGGSYPNEVSDAQVAEVIIYNVSLIDLDCRKIEGYLAWKWGLQANLPSGHPYKSAAP
jgi:hypothetical protein